MPHIMPTARLEHGLLRLFLILEESVTKTTHFPKRPELKTLAKTFSLTDPMWGNTSKL